jgi:hypothetical protein
MDILDIIWYVYDKIMNKIMNKIFKLEFHLHRLSMTKTYAIIIQ